MNRSILNSITAIAIAFSALVATSIAHAKEVKVTDAAFKFNKVKYWRGKAENVRIGSYGEKKTSGRYLAIDSNINAKHLSGKVNAVGPFSINFKTVNKGSIGAGLRYLTANGSASFDWKKAKNGKLKLMKFFVDEGALKKVINKKAGSALKSLRDEGRDGRVVSEIWVVVEASFGEQIANEGSFDVSVDKGKVRLSGNGSASSRSRTQVELPANSTFAYLMHKVKKWNKKGMNKTTISNMEDDQPGMR